MGIFDGLPLWSLILIAIVAIGCLVSAFLSFRSDHKKKAAQKAKKERNRKSRY